MLGAQVCCGYQKRWDKQATSRYSNQDGLGCQLVWKWGMSILLNWELFLAKLLVCKDHLNFVAEINPNPNPNPNPFL